MPDIGSDQSQNPDLDRMTLIAQAHQKWERDQLIAQAHQKWDSENAQAPQTSAAMAGLEHFGNAASLGYLPQLQAVAARAMPDPNAGLDAQMRAQGFNIQQPKDTYLSDRDANIKRMELEGQEHPYASAAGTVAGALTSGIASNALAPINSASRMGRIAQAARGGALLGAASNPGDTEGQVADGLQLTDRAKNAGVGGLIGGAGQGLIEGATTAAKAVTGLPEKLQGMAEERAFKASGAMLKDYRKAAGQDRINELGRYMLDNGLIKPGMNVEEIAQAAESLKGEHGKAIQGILAKLDNMGAQAPSAESLASAVEGQAAPLKNLNTAQPTYKTLQDVANDMRTLGKEAPIGVSRGTVSPLTGKGTEYLLDPETGSVMAQFRDGNLVTTSGSGPASSESASAKTIATPTNVSTDIPGSFRNAQDIKKFISDQIDASGGWHAPNPSEKNQALRDVYQMVNQRIEDSAGKAAESVGDKSLLNDYLKSKSGYRNSLEIAKIAKDKVSRLNANSPFSLTDYLSGAGGMVAGAASGEGLEGKIKGGAMGLGLGLANKAARTYGTPYLSVGLDKAGALLGRTPLSEMGQAIRPALSAAERSPVAGAAAAGILSQPGLETNPLRSVAGEKPAQSPFVGREKWMQQGAQKLGLEPEDLQNLMRSEKGKGLLIQASDLPPGSKGMQKIMDQINQIKRMGSR